MLGGLLAAERELVAAWDALATHRSLARPIAARDRANVAALRAAGAAAAAAPRGARPGDLEGLLAAERTAAAACVAALETLRRSAARGVAFDVSVTHAAHESVLLAALGRDPLPGPFAGTAA